MPCPSNSPNLHFTLMSPSKIPSVVKKVYWAGACFLGTKGERARMDIFLKVIFCCALIGRLAS